MTTHRLLGLAGVAAHLLDGVAVDRVVRELRIVAEAAGDPLAAALGAHVAVAAVVLAAHCCSWYALSEKCRCDLGHHLSCVVKLTRITELLQFVNSCLLLGYTDSLNSYCRINKKCSN